MKELFLFSFIVVFIACQNSSHTKSVAENKPLSQIQAGSLISPLESMVCSSASEEPLDVAKELENPENPGFYFREVALRSELTLESNRAGFVCISDVTTSLEDENLTEAPERSAASNTDQVFDSTNIAEANSWEILTQRWEFVPETISSQNDKSLEENLFCEDTSFLADKGNLLSSQFGNSISKM